MTIENLNISLRTTLGDRAQVIIPLSPNLGISMVEITDSSPEIAVVSLVDGKVGNVLSDSTPFFTIGCVMDFIKQANTKYNTND
jgi:hypothetical protein